MTITVFIRSFAHMCTHTHSLTDCVSSSASFSTAGGLLPFPCENLFPISRDIPLVEDHIALKLLLSQYDTNVNMHGLTAIRNICLRLNSILSTYVNLNKQVSYMNHSAVEPSFFTHFTRNLHLILIVLPYSAFIYEIFQGGACVSLCSWIELTLPKTRVFNTAWYNVC
jgi:hypothetical protein